MSELKLRRHWSNGRNPNAVTGFPIRATNPIASLKSNCLEVSAELRARQHLRTELRGLRPRPGKNGGNFVMCEGHLGNGYCTVASGPVPAPGNQVLRKARQVRPTTGPFDNHPAPSPQPPVAGVTAAGATTLTCFLATLIWSVGTASLRTRASAFTAAK
jgi:hypothetical protein